jgi:hypothetical protein
VGGVAPAPLDDFEDFEDFEDFTFPFLLDFVCLLPFLTVPIPGVPLAGEC